jgi:hypothetical protein
MSDVTIFQQILAHQDDLNRELDECKARGDRALAWADTKALYDERAKYRNLREQAKAHGELYDCTLALSRWVSGCRAWRCHPTPDEILNEVHEVVWFYAPKLDDDDIYLLVDGVNEAFED